MFDDREHEMAQDARFVALAYLLGDMSLSRADVARCHALPSLWSFCFLLVQPGSEVLPIELGILKVSG